MNKNLIEKEISSNEVFSGRVIRACVDEVELPNGNTATREYVKHNGAVAIMAVTREGKILIEEQFRYAHRRVFFEIPAGKLDSPEEKPLDAAIRELREETGAVAEKMTYLGVYIPSPAILGERIYMYLAEGLSFGERELDEDEFLTVSEYDLDTLLSMVMRGEIEDGKTQIAVLKYKEILMQRANGK